MAQNFIACDREQELLLPPSLREWLPEGHLAWFVVEAVAALDLSGFYAAYRDNGQGRAAHDLAMMVALLLYSYAVGERSSRRIERRCVEDVASRVIAPIGRRITRRSRAFVSATSVRWPSCSGRYWRYARRLVWLGLG
jgi:transposase